MRQLLIIILSNFTFFLHGQTILSSNCSDVYIEIYEESGVLKSYSNLLCFDCVDCDLSLACYNQIYWYTQDVSLYTNGLPNRFYKDGSVHTELVCENELISYNHYSQEGLLIGQEFFYHKAEERKFFIFTGVWWKLINGQKVVLDELPTIYDSSYFEY